MALASVYYDVLNRIVIDASLNPAHTSERDCAATHLEQAQPDDLVLYDRGYNAFWLYADHRARHVAFCMRAKTHQGLEFKRFVESGAKQAIVTMHPNKPSLATCIERGLSTETIKLRLIRVELPDEVEVLMTNLTDNTTYSCEQFKDLYHQRWGCEENYKRLKQWLEIANFSGKSALSVRQDFYAKIVTANLTAFMSLATQQRVDKKPKRQHEYRVNFAQALSKMKHTVVALIRCPILAVKELIETTVEYISLTVEPLRKGRQFRRRISNLSTRNYFSSYKRTL